LAAAGWFDELESCMPRSSTASSGEAVRMFQLSDTGRYRPRPDDEGQVPDDDWPVVLVDWPSAVAYVNQRAAATGRPYRLLNELEWEKAARGVDGRMYPWGDFVDPNWCCILATHKGPAHRVGVGRFETDRSPYGVRGLGGNVRDWCANHWARSGPSLVGDRLVVDALTPTDPKEFRSVRGGAYLSVDNQCRSAARFADRPHLRFMPIGFRIARDLTWLDRLHAP